MHKSKIKRKKAHLENPQKEAERLKSKQQSSSRYVNTLDNDDDDYRIIDFSCSDNLVFGDELKRIFKDLIN